LGNGLRKTYIACTQPAYRAAATDHQWTKNQNDWQYLELATGHDAMVTSPDELAEMLLVSSP
jgi:hypothetical protein